MAADAVAQDFVLLQESVREAGRIALDYFASRKVPFRHKPDGSEVSEADLAVDHFLKTKLLEERPGYGWLSEEGEDDLSRLSASRLWVVDPIDGTRAFLQKKPFWVVSAGLVVAGRPVLGCVYNPVRDEFFAAQKGGGAALNGERIKVSRREQLAGSRIVATKGTFRPTLWAAPWPKIERFWANSIAYRICLVASGVADATLSLSGKSDWDVAAAQVIVEEAGGRLTAHDGSAYVYNQPRPRQKSVLAAGAALFPALLARTKTVDPILLGG